MAGYNEYFNEAAANCAQYVNAASCTQYYYGDVNYSNGCSNYSKTSYSANGSYYLNKSYSDCGNKYFNASDDCTQYGKYANSVSYTKNTSGASAYSLGINESLITGMDKITDSVAAIEHLRDKLKELVSNKPQQSIVDSTSNLTSVEDVDFNDGNAATTEKVITAQYQELKNKMFALASAFKSSGTSNIGTLASTDKSSGNFIHKQDIINIKEDLKAIAASCYQSYSNHQNYANGYVNYSVNACYNSAYAVYSRSDTCVQYARSTCTTNYSAYSDYSRCTKASEGACCAGGDM